MVKCPRCGYDNLSSSTYCVNCSYILKGQPTGKKKSGWNIGTGKKIALVIGIIVIAFLLFSFIYNATQPTNEETLNVVIADQNVQNGSSTPYQVKIIYDSTWYSQVGNPNSLKEYTGSGDKIINLDTVSWEKVHVDVSKVDSSSSNLTVQLLRNGDVVAENSTTDLLGGITINYQS